MSIRDSHIRSCRSASAVLMRLRHAPVAAACAAIALLATSPAASASPQPMSANLLVNGGAEIADASLSGHSVVTIPGWQVSGAPTIVPYGTRAFPTTSEGPPDRGNQFFGGGDTGDASLSQSVDLTGAAGTPFTLSGWLGRSQGNDPSVTVTATFLDAHGDQLGSAAIGAISWHGRAGSALHPSSTSGTVPEGTTSATVVVSFSDLNPYVPRPHNSDGFADDLSLTVGDPSLTAAPLTPPTSNVGALDHVFVIVMEDRGDSDIVGSPQAPYINSLINTYGFASDDHALAHPSDPNYLALLGGSDFGLDTECSTSCAVDAPSVLQELDQAGESWAFYDESIPSPCYEQAPRHHALDADELPWMLLSYVADNTLAYCQTHLLPLNQMSTDLSNPATMPNFVWIKPDACDDMERCGTATGDGWLQHTLSEIEDSATWTDPTQKSAVFITWDEDSSGIRRPVDDDNTVPLIVIPSEDAVTSGGMASGHVTATDYYNHYSLLRTIEEALGVSALTDNDLYATPLNEFW